MRRNQKCQAPWGCDNPNAKAVGTGARHIDGLSLCRSCYQYTFEQAQSAKVPWANRDSFIYTLRGPARLPGASVMKCEGVGCDAVFGKNVDNTKRRFVGRITSGKPICACRACYQRAHEYKANHPEVKTIEEAWKLMSPRNPRKGVVHA